MKTVFVAASAAMLISVAGCGSSTPEEAAGNEAAVAAPAAAKDPCAFATKEEVSAATGETIIQAQADGDRCGQARQRVRVHALRGRADVDRDRPPAARSPRERALREADAPQPRRLR